MVGEWRAATVGEIASAERNALVGGPFGSNLVSRDYVESGVPIIRGQNMGEGWIGGEFACVTAEKADSLSANIARPGDVIFTQRGTLGQVAVVPKNEADHFVVSQSQMKLTVDESIADPLFVYYVFRSPEQRDYVLQNAIQTGVPHTNLGILRSTPLPLPPIEEQRAIAHILGTLDDKIELNRRMNETLEEMARAIFKSWFVDFDPVRAKSEGRDPGLPKHIADLFPDSFEVSELGEIPAGWKVGVLDQFTRFVIGGDWGVAEPTEDRMEEAFCVRGADIPSLQVGGTGKMPIRYVKGASLQKRQLEDGDLVIEISGGSPTQSTGRPVHISQRLLDRLASPLICSNFCRLLKMKMPTTSKFIYLWLRSAYANDEFLQFENGTTGIKNFAFKLFSANYKLVTPPDAILEEFNQLVSPFFDQQQANAEASDTLTTIRDTLLPRLISGELRIPDDERMIEETVQGPAER